VVRVSDYVLRPLSAVSRAREAGSGSSVNEWTQIAAGWEAQMSLIGSGWLSTGQSTEYDVILSANRTYTVYVRPERSGVDFDLRIYDENGNLVQWDAICYITPRWRGKFRIFVMCAAGASNYGILVD